MSQTILRRLVHVVCIFSLLVCSVLSVQVGWTGVAKAESSEGQFWLFVVDEIYSYDQLSGQPQWVQQTQRRFISAIWRFNDDGTFAFAPTVDARTDLYPLWGTWEIDSNVVTFYAEATSRSGSTGSASVEIAGKIDFGEDSPFLTMTWSSGMINAAAVNDTSYGSNSLSSYSIEATLKPYKS